MDFNALGPVLLAILLFWVAVALVFGVAVGVLL